MSAGRKVALYARISADREGRELGVTRQVEDCRALAERRGWSVVAEHIDNDLSASTSSRKPRPGYQAILAAARAGEVDGVVTYSTSRLTRRPREYEDWIDLAPRVVIATVTAGDVNLSTADGRSMARVLAAMDARSAEETAERVRRAQVQRAQAGLPNGGGMRVFGWQKDGLAPVPAEQDAVRAAAAALIRGASLRSVARTWGRHPSNARKLLLSERVAGRLPDGTPAKWDAVLDPATHAAVRAVLNDAGRRASLTRSDRLLSGWARCGLCGQTVYAAVTRHGRPAYACSLSKHLIRTAAPIDEFVDHLVVAYLEREGVSAAGSDERAELTAGVEALRVRLDEVADMLGAGELTREQAARATAKVRDDLADAERRLAAAVTTPGVDGPEAWAALDVMGKRAALRALPWVAVIGRGARGRGPFDPKTVWTEWRTP